mgnify:CR=1 FL=1
MSNVIDQKVVEMRFDNKQFENNVQTSLSTLDRLKKNLNLEGATKGLENVDAASKKLNFSGLSSAVETVQAKFSAFEVMAVTALANITNSAINAGKQMLHSLTVEPVSQGFNEYELKMGSIQTIMASTGASLEEVNGYLADLNAYSDQTIYSFADMTQNIGKFTNAGVKLEDAVLAIKGISNEAAVSGANANEASRAMYNFAQALSAGHVKLIDWKSIENANMATVEFKNELLKAAEAAGTVEKQADGMYRVLTKNNQGSTMDMTIDATKNFNDSLNYQWMTTEVLVDTLKDYADETTEIGKKAFSAAQDVKTFSQLMDTLKEAVGSGWATTWELVFGNLEEAKELWTGVSEVVGGFIERQSAARNTVLAAWNRSGGRLALIESLENSFNGILSVIKPVNEAFREVFPSLKGWQLTKFTKDLRDFTENLKLSEGAATKLKTTFKGVFSLFDIGGKAISAIVKPVMSFLTGGAVSSFGNSVLDVTSSLGAFFIKLNEGIENGNGFAVVSETIAKALDGISNACSFARDSFGNLGSVFSKVGSVISTVASRIKDTVVNALTWISENISAGDIFAGLAGGGIFMLVKKLGGLADKIKDILSNFGKSKIDTSGFSDILSSIHDSLDSFQQGIKVASLVGIATAVMILASSLRKISEIEPVKIAYSLATIKALVLTLNSGFKSLSKTLLSFNAKGTIKASVSMIGIATAINILASAMKKIADLSLEQIARGLAALGGAMLELSVAIKIISKSNITLRTSVAMLALAQACSMLADALRKYASLSDEIIRGLTAMGGALLEFSAVLSILNKFAGGKALFGAAGILVASLALDEISENLEKMGNLSWDQIGRGLAAMGGALAEFGIVLGLLGKFTGFSSIFAATALLIGVQSLGKLAEGLERFGEMQWDEIGRGLTAMGVALLEVGAVIGTLGVLAGFAGIIGAASLLIAIQGLDDLANALKKFGSMQWDEIGRGLVAMGAALLEVGVVVGTLGALTGFAGIIGAGALLLAIQGLDDLANALAKFGAMQWVEIGKGLVAMGAALLEVGVVTGALGALTGLAGLVGAGTLLLAVQGLDDLANALKKFGSMQWDEIGRGLAAMGAAMGEVALGGLLNTLSGFGAASISKIAEPLGVLADSVKKWAGVTVPEELGAQLGELAGGILQFTFGGWGASAIAEVAAPLGTMADSISKWSNVDITEDLGDKIGSLASGVKAFTFGGLGAGAIAEAAPGIGQLSDAVRKWDGVVVPEDLESGLTSLATGVNAFSFAFAGGWSIGTLIGPLGDLVEPVKKWNYVKVPEGIDSSLKQLADGVNAFSFSFMSGWSLDTLVGPLGDLADAARKWNGVILEGVSQELTSFADSLKNLGTVSVSGLVLEFQNATGTLTQAVSGMLSSIIAIVNTRKSGVISVFVVMVGNVLTTLNGKLPNFQTFGQLTVKYMVMGIRSQAGLPIVAFGEIITDALSSIIIRNIEFYDAGRDMAAGFANGISANTFLAEAKAAEMAAAAARAARRELDEHSPSKVGYEIGDFFGVAFVGAISDYADKSYRAGAEMGTKARIGLTEAVSKISDYINSDMDTQPTIRPVLDLSNVQSGTRQINAMFSRTQAMSINANMNRARTSGNQNAGFQDGSGATYNYFTQNNYSPKALSRVEIYRQTKNQFSAMKGSVNKR